MLEKIALEKTQIWLALSVERAVNNHAPNVVSQPMTQPNLYENIATFTCEKTV